MAERSGDTRELRGDIASELMSALDALAKVEDKALIVYVRELLAKHVDKKLHDLTMLQRMLQGNPLLPGIRAESDRSNK
jgi:hypothetical protein